MALRAVTYTGERAGPATPAPDIVQRRIEMDKRGDKPGWPVDVTPHPAGPGKAEWVRPQGATADAAILYLHGSGFSKGSPASHRPLVARIVATSGIPAFVPDYRLTPEHRFPAALEDALHAYRQLLDRYDPVRIAVIGDSAGGGLAFAMLLAARDQGLAMPGAAVTLSAWTDLAVTGDPRPDIDDPLVTQPMLRRAAALYLDGADPFDPYASPLYGELAGFPPLLMQVGGREIMTEDTIRFAQKARDCGVAAHWTAYPGMTHVFQLNAPDSAEAAAAIAEIAAFLHGVFDSASCEAD